MTYPEPVDLSPLFRGDSRNIHLVITDGTIPVNLTGSIVSFCMKRVMGQATKDIEINITSHTTPLSGITDIPISSQLTSELVPDNYYYDIQLTGPTLQNKTLQFGTILIMEDVND